MTDAHDHGPRHPHALRLDAFAEAATAVLDSPSRCGEALFDALHECWLALQNVPGHLPPYRGDPREVVERFEDARTQLGRALREVPALAGAAHGGRPERGGTLEPDEAEDPYGRDDRDENRAEHEDEDRDKHEGEGAGEGEGEGEGERVDGTGRATSVEGTEADVGPALDQEERVADSPPRASEEPEDANAPEASETAEIPEASGTEVAPGTPDVREPLDPMNLAKPSVSVQRPATTEPPLVAVELTGAQPVSGSAHGSSPGSPAVPADPLADFAAVLERLESDLRREQVRYLPQPAPARRDDGDADAAERVRRIWRRVHMALLRLPGDVAAEWRTTAAVKASLAGLPVPEDDVCDLDVIVLGLPDGLCPAERLPLDFADLPAAAVAVDPKFLLHLGLPPAEIGALPPGDPRPAWAVRAAQAERLAALDPELHVALLHDHQPGSLAEREHRDKYERRLASLLRTAGQGLDEKRAWTRENRLGAAHHLDMVLGGLVHKRPAAPESWWYQWRTRVSRILVPLAEDANYEVIVRPLEDLRRDFAAEYTIAETVKGVAGSSEPEVQWVVWTALRRKKGSNYGPNKHKGRVVVRPAEPTRR
ncbi:hypothetical protein [Streptomyces fagopyri]|uniref:hypothetical protein n=1 Tax=Streptomyces fagopyri TaxID=2662397 RepID=UPI00381BC23C